MVPPQERPTFQAFSSAAPNSSTFDLPLSITSSASATTAPSTKPPATHPRKLPAPVDRGLAPARPRHRAPCCHARRERDAEAIAPRLLGGLQDLLVARQHHLLHRSIAQFAKSNSIWSAPHGAAMPRGAFR